MQNQRKKVDYLAKILHINHLTNVDISLYDDRLALVAKILDILGANHEVFSKGTSIGTAKFGPELKTLTLIMFSNLYPLSNTGFINLGRAQFLCDLIIGAQIDICSHISDHGENGRTISCTNVSSLLQSCHEDNAS